MHGEYLPDNFKIKDHLGDLSGDGSILKRTLKKYGVRACTGLGWLRIGSIIGLL
jgi:hypothetical protein